MKTVQKFAMLFCIAAMALTVSCSKDQDTNATEEENLLISKDKQALMQDINSIQSRAPISYLGEICEDDINGSTTLNSYADFAQASYYSFEGTAGDVVSLNVTRTSAGLDPGMTLFFGTTSNSDGLSTGGSSNPNMTFLGSWDDNVSDPFGSCFSDPAVTGFVLPSTGTYTLVVYDVLGCGAPYNYVVQSSGISCVTDADGDGCDDDSDPHPNSNFAPTVVINGCDSGVPNQLLGCSTMADLIADCGGSSSCIVNLANSWRRAGLITGRQNRDLQNCAN